jgi:hypothetical protein
MTMDPVGPNYMTYDGENLSLATIPSGREGRLMYECRVQNCDDFRLERA